MSRKYISVTDPELVYASKLAAPHVEIAPTPEVCLYKARGSRPTHTHVCGNVKGHEGPHLCGDCTRYFNLVHSWLYTRGRNKGSKRNDNG